MSFRPLHDRVLVQRLDADQRSRGGLYLPESAQEKPRQARVVAVGPGLGSGDDITPLTVKPGDIVLFGKFTGEEITLDGETHLILSESELLGIVHP